MPRPSKLYLIRHGLAEERGDEWPDDAARPLTRRGISRLEKTARRLARLGVEVEVVFTSPLVRASQTAEILAAGLDPHPRVVMIDSLAPGGSPQAVLADLEQHGRPGHVALVGHEPGIGELAARLIGLREPLAFKKGAVCRIDVGTLPPSRRGSLVWLLPPRVLRNLRS